MPAPLPPRTRILSKVIIDPETGCWNWQGARDRRGYGRVGANYKLWLAHRLSYTDFICDIPEGFSLDHLCRNPRCVNPMHLEPVTQQENAKRAGAAGAMNRYGHKTSCKHGHEYTRDNTHIDTRGHRVCRICSKIKAARQRDKLRHRHKEQMTCLKS